VIREISVFGECLSRGALCLHPVLQGYTFSCEHKGRGVECFEVTSAALVVRHLHVFAR